MTLLKIKPCDCEYSWKNLMVYQSFLKRFLDLTGAVFGCLLLSPAFLLMTFFLTFANRGKPFFCQRRPGKNGQPFKIIKFRTMSDKKGIDGQLLSDEQRLTKTGAFIRKRSLDEIPQLFNVMKGDMSLIGPRPLLAEYLELYNEEQARRQAVRPGITGWAQVNGRNALDWETKFRFDVWYVDHLSFLLDVKILFLTLKKVWEREGIGSGTSVTAEKFTGNQK